MIEYKIDAQVLDNKFYYTGYIMKDGKLVEGIVADGFDYDVVRKDLLELFEVKENYDKQKSMDNKKLFTTVRTRDVMGHMATYDVVESASSIYQKLKDGSGKYIRIRKNETNWIVLNRDLIFDVEDYR